LGSDVSVLKFIHDKLGGKISNFIGDIIRSCNYEYYKEFLTKDEYFSYENFEILLNQRSTNKNFQKCFDYFAKHFDWNKIPDLDKLFKLIILFDNYYAYTYIYNKFPVPSKLLEHLNYVLLCASG